MYNCKNCGAPLTSTTCEYCGTRYDTSDIDCLKNQDVGRSATFGCSFNEAAEAFYIFSKRIGGI